MRLYNASLYLSVFLRYQRIFPNKKIHILRSFGLPSRDNNGFLITHKKKSGSIILDSGTWSLNNRKSGQKYKITLKGYMEYLRSFGHLVDFYFNYDSNFTDDGFATNVDNQMRLEDVGLKPVPVVHDIDGDEIEHYIERQYPIVALGSSQIKNLETLLHVIDRFEGTGVKLHLFGNTTFDFLTCAPIYSCDSVGWANTGKYGFIRYWNPAKRGANKADKIYLEQYVDPDDPEDKVTYSSYKFKGDLDRYLADTFGLNYEDLISLDSASNTMLVNLHFYVQLEEIVNEIHRKKGFPVES